MPGHSKNKLVATNVFGVEVTYLSVTVLSVAIAHVPVNVATRKDNGSDPSLGGPNANALLLRFPASTLRTTEAMRSAAGRVNVTR